MNKNTIIKRDKCHEQHKNLTGLQSVCQELTPSTQYLIDAGLNKNVLNISTS
jgi:glutamate/tyrosine decarboxylase-like PLP-dependent enzyme